MGKTATAPVPLVSLAGGEEAAVAAITGACKEHGFFYAADHGVPQAMLDAAFDAMRRLFALPREQKLALLADSNNRGYTPLGEQTLDPDHQSQGDTKEGYYIGHETPATSPAAALPLHGPNVWPPEELLPGFRSAMEQYYETMGQLAARLMRLVALALGLPLEALELAFGQPMLFLRLLHYAPQKSAPEEGVYGAGAHTDYGLVTLLATDGVPGLQVHYKGAWLDVGHVPGVFICNLGDMLEIWTNGTFRSTPHRVVNAAGVDRYSMPFFVDPAFDLHVAPLPQFCTPERPAAYAPTSFGQHLLGRYAKVHAGYQQGGGAAAAAAAAAQEQWQSTA